ncbi:TIGR03943 family protein [Kitasatospora kazusensis]|uniref:TIGR03943 family protein n=1 Tax=Kitasatospora kazusensis TaxID=407974 RepID=A0ABN2Z3R1_9ACTN
MRRFAPAALLVLTGSALLRVSLLSDLYLRYVKAGLRPLVIASGVLLIALGVIAVIRDRRRPPTAPERHGPDEHDDHGHSHSPAGPRTAWLLAAPAVMLLLFAPPALGSYTVARDGSGAVAKRTVFPPLPAQDPLVLTLTDYGSRAVWDDKGSLKGRTVRLTGFVTPVDATTWHLSRLIVTCCAADAKVVTVLIHGVPAPSTDSWVTVTGTWHQDTAGPALDATGLTSIATPKDQYQDTVQP